MFLGVLCTHGINLLTKPLEIRKYVNLDNLLQIDCSIAKIVVYADVQGNLELHINTPIVFVRNLA